MEIESEYSQAESAANKYLCVSILMLVDWDTIAGWAGEKQGRKEAELYDQQHFPTPSLYIVEPIKTLKTYAQTKEEEFP